jgi:hypothetical protein
MSAHTMQDVETVEAPCTDAAGIFTPQLQLPGWWMSGHSLVKGCGPEGAWSLAGGSLAAQGVASLPPLSP